MLFIRNQVGPYVQACPVLRKFPDGAGWHWDEVFAPVMHTPAPVPHGRNDYTGEPSDWGPDAYGYTDFDDYHLAIYGA